MNKDVPKSYDEIVRSTVPDPDSSARPTQHQEHQAREGFRALDDDETALAARVQAAVNEAGVDVEIERDAVTLHGRVRDAQTITRIEDAVSRIAGVSRVINRLVVGS